ncbi:MAG: SRPBCC family protein [Solirubrobacteraceae bacterium]
MPTARRSRTIAAPAQELWDLLRDPHHLPRWWPRVTRVEDVEEDAFTEVMRTRKGKLVRADFSVRCDEAGRTLTWVQRIEGTPFASVLKSAETELQLRPVAAAAAQAFAEHDGPLASAPAPTGSETEVTIELRQEMATGSARYSWIMAVAPRFGGPLVRRAAAATLEQALDGLERISG